MSKLLRDMPVFVEVAKQKSFTRAADALDMPLSTVSRRIIAMEKEVGAPLFNRSSRNVELTEAGRQFHDRCSYIVAEAELALDELKKDLSSPAGRLRVAIGMDLYFTNMRGVLSDFVKRWPDITMQITLTDRRVDLLTEPFDLDVRVGEMPDSGLKVRKLISLELRLYASPALLERYPAPRGPEDLVHFPCIAFEKQSGTWTIRNECGETETAAIDVAHMVNNIGVASEFVLAGMGASWFPVHMAAVYEKKGELVHILKGWSPANIDINLIMPTRQLPHRVRLFADHLVDYFSQPGKSEEWYR